MFGGDDEDGDFLSPTGGAKLASLFGLDRESSQGNESFQYTAPKQPRKSTNPAPSNQKAAPQAGAPAVLFATAVQAFRYINDKYVKQGKLGAAVLGSHTTKEYKLLLYLSQQKQVTTAKIHVGFVFTVQPNNYCTFYDDQRQNWSLMFESDKAAVDFCKEICLAKANSSPSLDTVVVQDLSLGEGQGVENGDSLEVVYTGWLLQNHTIGQMFDSNHNKDKLLRLKIGAGKVIKGWEEGMLGMKKEGSRLIVIPPSLAYGSKGVPNRVPSDSTLIFEAELRRVKFSKDSGSDRASASSRDSAAPSPAPSTAPSVQNPTPEPPVQPAASGPGRPGEPPLRAKSNSLSEQLANPDATKAKLISRMAKMGQPMLPFMTEVAGHPESSDSELEDTSGSRAKDQAAASSPVQITSAAPASAYVHPHPHNAQMSALLPVMTTVGPQPGLPGSSHAFQPYSYTQTSATPSQLQPVGQVYPAQTVPYMGSGDVTSFLMTEARQHNTEIRLSVGKVADKVDQLASKIDDLQRQGSLSMGVPNMSMETSMIMHNIQRIVQENECLKKEVFEKSARIEEQNHKIGELINQNQRYIEQSHQLLEQRNDSLKSSSDQNQARLLQAEQDKVRLTEDLALSASRVSQLQLDASAHQQKSMELQNKLGSALQDSERHCQRIASLETQLDELKEVAERAQTQYRSEKQRRKEMELKVNTMEEELQDLKTDKESLERALSERKKKWQAERQRRDEEVEELRKSSQQELDNLRAQLRKARSSSDNAVSEQLSQLQLELDEEWKRKCDHMLTSAKEQHRGELAELTEQRDELQDKLSQLQEKFTALKQSRDSEEQSLLQHGNQSEELQALQQKYASLEQQGAAVREKLESRVAELERQVEEQDGSGDTAAEVKRVMNGVYHSLRGEFDLSESYSGQAVLGVIVSTIKNVTLQLLSGTNKSALRPHKEEEEEAEEEEEESEDVKQSEEKPLQNVNGKKEESKQEEKEEEESVADSGSLHVSEVQVDQDAASENETETVLESKTQSQAEASAATDLHSVSTTAPEPQETAAAESEVHHEQGQPSAPETCEGSESAHPDDGPDKSLPPEDGQAVVSDSKAAVSTEVGPERAPVEELNDAPHKAFGPPANPPPPPNMLQTNSGEDTSLTGGVGEENGEEPFFQNITRAKPPAAPSEEEEEDEMSLKGRPPPAPLFGEDEDELDWLN
ncbi:FK506-binding protein 15 isoform X3 [Acanthochromis polyacanthus]|uniref:FK506-binding protein 15 isoform X3 n=1 Tax=Acanthochromis polyacanthus TaxID=80966 RepID=UPI002234C687|nr:FK506-binding protein 15 isoform X3 [Acanthochromis polyacanthus]